MSDSVNSKARELLASRLAVVDRLEQAKDELDAATRQLREKQASASEAWTAATAAGWTRSELKQLGFEQPAARRGGRPKGSRSRSTRPAPQAEPANS